MGAKPSKVIYSIPVTEAKAGETAVHRAPDYEHGLLDNSKMEGSFKTTQEMLLASFKTSSERNCLGYRVKKEDGTLENKFTWETYGQLGDITQALGAGMVHLKLSETNNQEPGREIKFISIYAPNTREWYIVDMANQLYGFATMPIYDTLGEEATDFMFNQTELKSVFLTCNHIKGVVERMTQGKVPHLKNLIVMDPKNLTDEHSEALGKVTHYTLPQVIKAGRDNPSQVPVVTEDQVIFLSYTSGTTGNPKGAMVTNKNLMTTSTNLLDVPIPKHAIHLSYLPMAHVFERVISTLVFLQQGAVGVFNGNPKKIKDDLAALKPDFFISVPRLFNKFHAAIKGQFDALSGITGFLARSGLSSKLSSNKSDGSCTHMLWDSLVFKKTKAVLGGRCQFMITASAPMSTEVKKFLEVVFCCKFYEAYGQTEACGAEFFTNVKDVETGHVGGPGAHLEFKLLDVPEMDYRATDKDEQGKSAPRGEILVRSAQLIPGYYKNKAKTDEAIDKDGWLHSGDVGMILPETGALKIIDRRKNIFKLSIGEYIAAEKLEEAYKNVTGIEDLFVYGDSLKSHIIAIIHSTEPELSKIAKQLNVTGSYSDWLKNEKINEFFMKGLADRAKEIKLRGFEKIRKLALVGKSFEEEGILTATFKLKRHPAKILYKEILDGLYVGSQ